VLEIIPLIFGGNDSVACKNQFRLHGNVVLLTLRPRDELIAKLQFAISATAGKPHRRWGGCDSDERNRLKRCFQTKRAIEIGDVSSGEFLAFAAGSTAFQVIGSKFLDVRLDRTAVNRDSCRL